MDTCLKSKGLDLKFTCYKVLPFSSDSGVLEFIDKAKTIQHIQLEHNRDLFQFLAGLGDVTQTYMDSCSGMAVATYLLGVGDRHLENLMV